jgi:hypothetical protein
MGERKASDIRLVTVDMFSLLSVPDCSLFGEEFRRWPGGPKSYALAEPSDNQLTQQQRRGERR